MVHSFNLQPLATDSISKLSFVSRDDQPLLLASSWDKNMYIYDIAKQKLIQKLGAGSAVLSCTSRQDQGLAFYSAGLDGSIKRFEWLRETL
jgi:WD40 repeat protein